MGRKKILTNDPEALAHLAFVRSRPEPKYNKAGQWAVDHPNEEYFIWDEKDWKYICR